MISQEEADRIAAAWLRDWNAHDLDAIMSHYADPLVFTSPLVVDRLGRADGTIRDKETLRAYFAQGVSAGSPLRFELIKAAPGVSSVAIVYRNHRGRTVVETMTLDAARRATAVQVHYA